MALKEKFKCFSEKYIYVFIVVCALVFLLLPLLIFNLAGGRPGNITTFYIIKIFTFLIPTALILAAAYPLHLLNKSDFSAKKLGWGLLIGLPLMLLLLLFNNTLHMLTSGQLNEGVSFLTVILFILFYIVVGFSEEIVCRGIIFNALRSKHGYTGKGLLCAIVLSSFIFGVVHFINLMYGSPLIPTTSQVLYSAVIGVFFCAVYVRVGSLLPLIIIHALVNMFSGLKDILTVAGSDNTPVTTELPQAELTLMDMFTTPLFMLPFMLFGLFLIRKQLLRKDGGDLH